MAKIVDWLDELIGALSFLALVMLMGYAIHKGALRDEPLAIVLVVLALLTPSPTKLLIKWRDFVAQRRKNSAGSDLKNGVETGDVNGQGSDNQGINTIEADNTDQAP